MSCEMNSNKAGRTAGVKAGISAAQGKFNSAAGRMIGAISRSVGRSATAALRITESFDGPSLNSLAAIPVVLEAGALLGSLRARRRQKLADIPVPPAMQALMKDEPRDLPAWADRWTQDQDRPDPADRLSGRVRQRAVMAVGLLKLGQATSAFAGTGLARLSRAGEPGVTAGLEQQFFFPASTMRPVRMWQSRLTPWFNRADAGVSGIQRGDGLMIESQGQTWHRGTTVIKTTQGERTMTHLQSMTAPATHYYFNRRLSDNETVGLITGQKGFEPKSLEGYAGQVGEVEALLPAWAQTKHGLIQAHLRWGEQGRAGERGSKGAGEQGTRSGEVGEQGSKGAGERGNEEVHPLDGVKAQVKLGGQDYPVLVRRVTSGPGGRPLADATYYDAEAGVWKAVDDEDARARLAEQVSAGQIEPWEKVEASS